MSRLKRRNNKYWSKEEKLSIVKSVTEEGYFSKQLEEELNIDSVMVRRWVRIYLLKKISFRKQKRKRETH